MTTATCRLIPAVAALLCAGFVCRISIARGGKNDAPPTDEKVAAAVRKGLDYLYSVQKPDGTWPSKHSSQHPGGIESLVLLTALSAGESADRAELARALKHIDSAWPETVYARSVRAMVYARLSGRQYADRLKKDVKWLVSHQGAFGGWGYGPGHSVTRQRPRWVDNSNTQLAALALLEAAEADAPAPQSTWSRLRVLWMRSQNSDGGWGYTPPIPSQIRLKESSYGSMTAAGVVTSYMIARQLAAAEIRYEQQEGREPGDDKKLLEMMRRSVTWLNRNYKPGTNPGWLWGEQSNWSAYHFYNLARAAEAAGMRTVGGRDWYGDVAAHLLASQSNDGSWPATVAGGDQDTIVRTCFSLLALITAGKPVLVNKVVLPVGAQAEADAYLDAANLVRWFGSTESRPVTWQLLSHEPTYRTLAEAPILYLVCPEGAAFSEKTAEPLERFVRHGGTVIAVAGRRAVAACRAYFLALFPDYQAAPLEAGHPVFSLRYEVPAAAPFDAIGIGDRCRVRIFIIPPELRRLWRAGPTNKSRPAFEFFTNMALYGTDKGKLKGKFAARRPAREPAKAISWLDVARISHGGDWNTNPWAMRRLNEVLTRAVSIGVRENQPVSLARTVDEDLPLLWLTGSVPPKLDARRRENLKGYLAGGGMLFIDPAVGDETFFKAAKELLGALFGPAKLKPLPTEHHLITGQFAGGLGSDVRRVSYSRALGAREPELRTPVLYGLEIKGRLAVVLSRYGVTCPLEGGPTYGMLGLATDDARRLAANVVLYAALQSRSAQNE